MGFVFGSIVSQPNLKVFEPTSFFVRCSIASHGGLPHHGADNLDIAQLGKFAVVVEHERDGGGNSFLGCAA